LAPSKANTPWSPKYLTLSARSKLSSVETFKLDLGLAFPILTHIPTQRFNLFKKFRLTSEEISKGLLERTRNEKEGDVEEQEGSFGHGAVEYV
jgi:hypothetical protein